MTDIRKFKYLLLFTTVLIGLILTYNVLAESVLREAGNTLQRRLYYEKIISKRGLSLHQGDYWREKK
jgi:hypothetical protein